MIRTRTVLGPLAAIVVAVASLAAEARAQDPLALSVTPSIIHPGETVTFDVTGGGPYCPVALYISQFGFAPIFCRIAVGAFDPSGAWTLQAQVPLDPPINTDVDVTFCSYGICSDGYVEGSNFVTVTFTSS